ncbi:hypothetical protein F4813DRAFT_68206 [Daldinia decipiens]|uniref:uncharacterized protein n=1 Tax=Daldinia decipiens TaxID=326647 RepID=UPI0020C2E583|nr:uncharacterized protein F4813DRAFT_68206 [Daldinia decipiens]KAI1658026.1 hypothetical protein F4813DRAFT_68206 [Daldinia decipiens]
MLCIRASFAQLCDANLCAAMLRFRLRSRKGRGLVRSFARSFVHWQCRYLTYLPRYLPPIQRTYTTLTLSPCTVQSVRGPGEMEGGWAGRYQPTNQPTATARNRDYVSGVKILLCPFPPTRLPVRLWFPNPCAPTSRIARHGGFPHVSRRLDRGCLQGLGSAGLFFPFPFPLSPFPLPPT